MKKLCSLVCILLPCIGLSSCLPIVQTVEGLPQHEVAVAPAAKEQRVARHVILMIGDGMGPEHTWTAWACNGGKLNLERMPVCGWSRTSSASHAITDSAAGGTAIACGERTANGTVGQSPEGHPLTSIATELRQRGWRTGMAVTKSITDATPASFYAHAKSRHDTSHIAAQLESAGFSVLLGGGADDVPAATVERLQAGGALVELSAPHDLPPAVKRSSFLPQAVERALGVLGKDDSPFFLMVEGSQIDMASHWNSLRKMAAETLEFDRTLAVVLEWLKAHPDTLVIVTADHQTGGLALLGADSEKGSVRGVFTTHRHSGLAVPVYAAGAGALHFAGIYDNRSIHERILRACGRGKKGQ